MLTRTMVLFRFCVSMLGPEVWINRCTRVNMAPNLRSDKNQSGQGAMLHAFFK